MIELSKENLIEDLGNVLEHVKNGNPDAAKNLLEDILENLGVNLDYLR